MDEKYTKHFEAYPSLALIGNTNLVRVRLFEDELPDVRIYAKCEWTNPGGSLKDRPVMKMLLDAINDGRLTKDKTILDSSSGNAGIAYAMIGGMMGYKVELVVPGNASAERKKRILAHGATLTQTDPLEGYDAALRHCHQLYEDNKDKYFLSDQYSNDSNWQAHFHFTAGEIIAQTEGRLTHFVGGVGTGGSITGIGRRLKEHNKDIRVVSVLPDNFPGIEGLKPLENPEDIRPKILDESVIDDWKRVTIDDAFDYCARLAKSGLFLGQSSGAYLKVAHDVAKEIKKGTIVTIFCDIGERYFSTRLWD
ncbi:PLP-dependent cysteine synthase family protein [bacterium]|nr:PLP-dependent cysteine synthase family protein [bacterium]